MGSNSVVQRDKTRIDKNGRKTISLQGPRNKIPKLISSEVLELVASLEVYRSCMGTITVKKIKDATLRTYQLEP